ncbi:pyruvate dehydrogenase complex dihydrolipoamide acetyltransferase [soil metagenome]
MSVVIMPKMGDGMEEGTLLRWLKDVGDEIAAGDPLAEIETDKVALEIEASEGGVLTQTMVNEGDTVPIGTPIATIGEPGSVPEAPAAEKPEEAKVEEPVAVAAAEQPAVQEAAPAAQEAAPAETAATPPAAGPPAAAAENGAAAAAPERAPGERLRASPIVKRLAAEHGIELSAVAGTGPGGRIVKDDLTPYLTGAQPIPTAAPAEAAPAAASIATPGGPRPAAQPREMSRIRKTTGKRMKESKDLIPHFYVSTDVDMAAAMDFRKQVNGQLPEDQAKVSVNDLIVKAAALALREHSNLNVSLEGDTLYDHENIDINVAVAVENGLIAPFVPDADKLTLGTIAKMTKDLIGRAREGGLLPEEYQGGTFTISNLGMMDVVEFIAIINPPQAAILAVGSIYEMPVVVDGELALGQRMKITLSADHRVTDGAEVAIFLKAVKGYLQNPLRMVI